MISHKDINHFSIYQGLLGLLAVSLPLSEFFMSISLILLSINWLVERNYREKFNLLLKRKSIILFVSILLVHFIGLIWTDDFQYAWNDIRIKLPLLVLPVVIGTSRPLTDKCIHRILFFFIASVTAGTLINTMAYLGWIEHNANDIRNISIFISHIRFSLMIDMAIFSSGYFIFSSRSSLSSLQKVFFAFLIVWLTVFLFLILQSFTGIIIYLLLFYILTLYYLKTLKTVATKVVCYFLLISVPLFILSYIILNVVRFYNIDEVDLATLDKRTRSGNFYWHDIKNLQIENGHYTWLYVCEKELRDEWNMKSRFPYDSLDSKSQEIKYTLIRYLTSKGYRKDADGIKKLNAEDIQTIESGTANYLLANKRSFYTRMYEFIWQIDFYIKGGNPSGHSLTQRMEYSKTGAAIISDHFWLGVGTGDLQSSFNAYYNRMKSPLTNEWRRRAHNQFLTFFIAFGFIGALWIYFVLFFPLYLERKNISYFLAIALIIGFLSMLNEDTLETQPGITYFVFFYALLLLGRESPE